MKKDKAKADVLPPSSGDHADSTRTSGEGVSAQGESVNRRLWQLVYGAWRIMLLKQMSDANHADAVDIWLKSYEDVKVEVYRALPLKAAVQSPEGPQASKKGAQGGQDV